MLRPVSLFRIKLCLVIRGFDSLKRNGLPKEDCGPVHQVRILIQEDHALCVFGSCLLQGVRRRCAPRQDSVPEDPNFPGLYIKLHNCSGACAPTTTPTRGGLVGYDLRCAQLPSRSSCGVTYMVCSGDSSNSYEDPYQYDWDTRRTATEVE